jgi:hypothetical protein
MEYLTIDKYNYDINLYYDSNSRTLKNKTIDTFTGKILNETSFKPIYLIINIYPKQLIEVVHKSHIENNSNIERIISEHKKLYQPYKIKICDNLKYVLKNVYLINNRFKVEEYNTNLLFIIEDSIKEISSLFINSEQILKIIKPQLYLYLASLN